MRRIAWLTDNHLNFLSADDASAFIDSVARVPADAVLIGGDVAEWPDVVRHLRDIAVRLKKPVYFVLGNHDYYHSSIGNVREHVVRLCDEMPQLTWLSGAGVVELAPDVGLVGHGGWADARLGDYGRSDVMLNDYRLIVELADLGKEARRSVLESLADQAADHIRKVLPEALGRYDRVFLLTHVPPFREACWHEGRTSDDDWLPHFACKAMGDAILKAVRLAPDSHLTVLCGHTHGRGEVTPANNLLVLTGGAEYGAPEIQRVFELD